MVANEAWELLNQVVSLLGSEPSMAPISLRGKAQVLPAAPKALYYLSHLLPQLSSSSSPPGLCTLSQPPHCSSDILGTSSRRAFAHVSSAWNALSLIIHMTCSLTSSGLYEHRLFMKPSKRTPHPLDSPFPASFPTSLLPCMPHQLVFSHDHCLSVLGKSVHPVRAEIFVYFV